jgi:hypothetical protein
MTDERTVSMLNEWRSGNHDPEFGRSLARALLRQGELSLELAAELGPPAFDALSEHNPMLVEALAYQAGRHRSGQRGAAASIHVPDPVNWYPGWTSNKECPRGHAVFPSQTNHDRLEELFYRVEPGVTPGDDILWARGPEDGDSADRHPGYFLRCGFEYPLEEMKWCGAMWTVDELEYV